jgi:pimeloyl-ACP methyl ester carboxylesterase
VSGKEVLRHMADETGSLIEEKPVGVALTTDIHSRFVVAGDIKTHFLEAGSGFPVVLLHSGEFGGGADLSWEFTIVPPAEYFRVIVPDWAGFGKTEKVFSLDDMWAVRIRHITAFLQVLGLESAHFIGDSMGGTPLLHVLASTPCPWPVKKVAIVSGGGSIPENAARETLNSYDGSLDHIRPIVDTMFMNPQVRADSAYIERRHKLSQQDREHGNQQRQRGFARHGARVERECRSRRIILRWRNQFCLSPVSRISSVNRALDSTRLELASTGRRRRNSMR